MEMTNYYDVIVVGAGPAGLTAALYAARANRKVLVLDGLFGSGEAGKIAVLENYPGIASTDGYSLLASMKAQAKAAGAEFVGRNATSIEVSTLTVSTAKGDYEAKNIIFATGCKAQKLGVSGERELIGNGISYCATCDGPLYKNKTVALVGRGVKAEQDVEYLASIAQTVYYICDQAPTSSLSQNVKVIKGKVARLNGNPLQEIVLEDGATIKSPILFVNIGYFPETAMLSGQVETDEKGYLVTDENMQTSRIGLYAVGDVRKKSLRQVVTACADGAIAAEHAVRRKK